MNRIFSKFSINFAAMIEIALNKNLRRLNTFGLDVSCRRYVEYDSVEDLAKLFAGSDMTGRWMHIGGGSNLLFTADYDGTVLHSRIGGIGIVGKTSDGTVSVEAGASVPFDDFVAWSAGCGLWGAENLSHIPGETGAAAVQNIGAYGVEMKDIVSEVRCFDTVSLQQVTIPVDQACYGYRESRFKHEPDKHRLIVTSVVMTLTRRSRPLLGYGSLAAAVDELVECRGLAEPDAMAVRDAVTATRRSKLPDPAETGSAGSFFKNPVVPADVYFRILSAMRREHGDDYTVPHYRLDGGMFKIPAAWLIDTCGLKGARRGGAAVWTKQPLVIVNADGNATAADILRLEHDIADSVKSRFGISLSPEVEHI